jgi:acyl carrier protein
VLLRWPTGWERLAALLDKPQEWRLAAIEDWLIGYVSRLTKLAPERIDVREPLVSYGLGSMDAVRLSGDLEIELKVKLEPTLLYDHPTIESIAAYIGGDSEAPASRRPFPVELERRLAEVASMSDDEALKMLVVGIEPPGSNQE